MKNYFAFIIRLFIKKKPIVPILRFDGVIGTGGGIGKGRINAENLETNIKKAFSENKPSAVAIIINSPGGSPVQSSLIYQRVRYLADKKDVPILVFIEDVAASGGYWLSCIGDEIFADKASIIGSIGVISASFGFTEAIQKLGVERRVYTTGKSKGSLDPFKPEKQEDVKMLKNIMNDTQKAFNELVNNRRGKKLNDDVLDYFKSEGFEVTSNSYFDIQDDYDIGKVDQDYLYDVLSKTDLNGADALFVSCTALPVLEIIDKLEKKLHTIVLSSNQALIWDTLVRIKKNNSVEGYGKLFQVN